MIEHKHQPTVEVRSFNDAWMGSIKTGHYQEGYNYAPIVCSCGINIRVNKDLSEWVENK